jgi:hypothetical protein
MKQKQIKLLKAANGLGYLLTALVLLTVSCGHWYPYDHLADGFSGPANSYPTQPAPAGTVTIGTSGDEQAFCVQETADKGFVIGGALGDSALVIKTDSKGNVLWTKTFSSSPYYGWMDMAVRELPDNGFLVYALTGRGDTGKSDNIRMMRVDASFNTVWEKSIKRLYDGQGSFSHFASVSLSPNNMFSIVESIDSNDQSNYLTWYYSLDLNSDTAVQMRALDSTTRIIIAASSSFDSGAIIAYVKRKYAQYTRDYYTDTMFISKIDKNSNVIWTINNGLGYYGFGFGIELTLNNTFLVVPHGSGPGFIKVDFSGNIIKIISNDYVASFPIVNTTIQNPTGGICAVGSLIPSNSGYGNDIWIFKLNDNGDTLWNKIYSGKNDDAGNAIATTSDGGFIIAGTTFSYGHGRNDIWLIKTDSNGNIIPLK